MATDDRDELIKRKSETSQLLFNAKEYLKTHFLQDYIDNFCGHIVGGNFAKSGVYRDNPQAYIRVVKTFMFMGDHLCSTPEYHYRRFPDDTKYDL